MAGLSPEQAAQAVELRRCPKCEAPAKSPCRTRSGLIAATYHTARIILVPALRDALAVPTGRSGQPGPGKVWTPGPDQAPTARPEPSPIRIGYAHATSPGQDLQIQLDALDVARCKLIFSETISSQVTIRRELDNALAMAHDLKHYTPDHPVILTIHELNRAARNPGELMAMAAALQSGTIQLEVLTGPLAGIHDPASTGCMLFAVLAAVAQLDRKPDPRQDTRRPAHRKRERQPRR